MEKTYGAGTKVTATKRRDADWKPSSSFVGVGFEKRNGKWRTSISNVGGGKFQSLGYHSDQEDAARAYDVRARQLNAELTHWSDPRRLNFPDEPLPIGTGRQTETIFFTEI